MVLLVGRHADGPQLEAGGYGVLLAEEITQSPLYFMFHDVSCSRL